MIGCLIAGGLALFAVSRLIHARRWGHAWGGCGRRHGGWHGHHWGHHGWGGYGPGYGPDDGDPWGPSFHNDNDRWGGGISGKRVFIRAILRRVNATPDQERAIGNAVEEFRADVKKLGAARRGAAGRRSRTRCGGPRSTASCWASSSRATTR